MNRILTCIAIVTASLVSQPLYASLGSTWLSSDSPDQKQWRGMRNRGSENKTEKKELQPGKAGKPSDGERPKGRWGDKAKADPNSPYETVFRHGGRILLRKADGAFGKQLWLRSDEQYLKSSSPAAMGDYQVLDTQGQTLAHEIIKKGRKASIRFFMPDEGYYNAYHVARTVIGDHLNIDVAKAEVLKHSCREGHEHYPAHKTPKTWSEAPIEIVRLRESEDNFHTRRQWGDKLKFKILRAGEPYPKARVTLETGSGWAKTADSDENGIATFQIIRDYFPEGEKFERRHRERYTITAEIIADEAGQLNAQVFSETYSQATLSGTYDPRKSDYESSAQGLMYGSVGFLVLGVSSYWYRKRREQPFKETRFDERD